VAELLRDRLGVLATADLDEAVFDVDSDALLHTARRLRDDPELRFDYLRCLSAVDQVEAVVVVYHLFSMTGRQKTVMKVRLVEPDLILPSVVDVWRGADWHEREIADLFGVEFSGHPNPRRLLLPDEFEGFPLRKSYPLAPLPTEDAEEEGE
jgi:NADH-quinone oxidoreductase subunit C